MPAPAVRARLGIKTVVLLSMVGCAGDPDAGPSYTATDSAGIEIVHSTRSVWTAGTAWRVTPEPRLEIGRMSGEDPYILDRVMGVTVLDDGGVAIAHMGDNTIRYYAADGTFLRDVGGQGGGPQEFEQIQGLLRHGAEIWGSQFGRSPAKVFDQEGSFLRAVTLDIPVDMLGAGVRGVFDDGSLLINDTPQTREATQEPRVATSTVVRQAGERLDRLVAVPAIRILPWPGRPVGMYQAFSPVVAIAVAGHRFYHSFPEDYEIIVRDTTGTVRRIIRRAWDPELVTETHVAAYVESVVNMAAEGGGEVPPRLREQRQALIDAQIYPEHHPAFERLEVDRTGHLWVERTDPDNPKIRAGWHRLRDTLTAWDVFDADGVWLGSVALPPRFMAYEFGEDYVAGVWKDELDVELVRVYGLERGDR